MLVIDHLFAGYGQGQVLQGLSLTVGPGDIVALLGRNGAGRSTTAKAIMGLVPADGRLEWKGRSLLGRRPFEIARSGIGYVPESRDVFPTLTVHQNLLLGQKRTGQRARWDFDDMYALFPGLRARQHTEAGALSGGEQQMLALCRTLMGDPDLIIIDEPTEGLAPRLVAQLGAQLLALKARGVSLLLIEQKLSMALSVADRVLVMGHGRIVFEGTPQRLKERPDVASEWLGV